MMRQKAETWVALALLALIFSVGTRQLVGGSDLVDFLAGLFLGLALALDVAYLLVLNRAR